MFHATHSASSGARWQTHEQNSTDVITTSIGFFYNAERCSTLAAISLRCVFLLISQFHIFLYISRRSSTNCYLFHMKNVNGNCTQRRLFAKRMNEFAILSQLKYIGKARRSLTTNRYDDTEKLSLNNWLFLSLICIGHLLNVWMPKIFNSLTFLYLFLFALTEIQILRKRRLPRLHPFADTLDAEWAEQHQTEDIRDARHQINDCQWWNWSGEIQLFSVTRRLEGFV